MEQDPNELETSTLPIGEAPPNEFKTPHQKQQPSTTPLGAAGGDVGDDCVTYAEQQQQQQIATEDKGSSDGKYSAAQVHEYLASLDTLLSISTRTDSQSGSGFATITAQHITELVAGSHAINRASLAFGRQNSQFVNRFLSLTMTSEGPFRMMHQCLAQIEQKRQALKENVFKLRELLIDLEEAQFEAVQPALSDFGLLNVSAVNFDRQRAQLRVQQLQTGLADAQLYIEGCVKEIAQWYATYEEIRTRFQIRPDWDEQDFENAEAYHHVRRLVRMAYREVQATGTVSPSTQEYAEQLGIASYTINALCRMRLESLNQVMEKQLVTINQIKKDNQAIMDRWNREQASKKQNPFKVAGGAAAAASTAAQQPSGPVGLQHVPEPQVPDIIESHNWVEATVQQLLHEHLKMAALNGLYSPLRVDFMYLTKPLESAYAINKNAEDSIRLMRGEITPEQVVIQRQEAERDAVSAEAPEGAETPVQPE